MNGKEYDILKEIRNDIKKTQDAIDKNRDEFIEVKTEFAETRSDVKNLVNWVTNINSRLEDWTKNGCPHGQVNATAIVSNKEQIKDIKENIRDTNKKAAALGTGSGAIIALLIQIISALVGK